MDAAVETGAAIAALRAQRHGQARRCGGALIVETLPRERSIWRRRRRRFAIDVLRDALALSADADRRSGAGRAGRSRGAAGRRRSAEPQDHDARRSGAWPSACSARHGVAGLRIGNGYDLHRLVAGRPLILGGVTIPFDKGLLGHSDADVGLSRRDRCDPRRRRCRRHRPAFPGYRSGAGRAPNSLELLRRAVAIVARGRLRGRQRRRRRDRAAAEAGCRTSTRCARNLAAALGCDAVAGQRQGEDERRRRLDRRGRIDRRARRRAAWHRTFDLRNDGMMRLRFAPSPTGQLHVGNARTALFNWLLAQRSGRHVHPAHRRHRRRALDARVRAGHPRRPALDGPRLDEGSTPAATTVRIASPSGCTSIARTRSSCCRAAQAYHCFCSAGAARGRPPGRARGGTAAEVRRPLPRASRATQARRRDRGRRDRPSIRFRVPEAAATSSSTTSCAAKCAFNTDVIGDPVLVRSDGVPAYNFAVVIDDALMEITHVIRGEDHISNTPRQILLYEAFGWRPPAFAHVSLVMGPDHTPLSKRHGATSVAEFRARGYLPEALTNYLALIGWSPGEGEELLPLDELARRFRARGRRPQRGRVRRREAGVGQSPLPEGGGTRRVWRGLAVPYLQQAGWVSDAVRQPDAGVSRAAWFRLRPRRSIGSSRFPRAWRFCSTTRRRGRWRDAGDCRRRRRERAVRSSTRWPRSSAQSAPLLDREAFRAMAAARARADGPEGQGAVPSDPAGAHRRSRGTRARPRRAGDRARRAGSASRRRTSRRDSRARARTRGRRSPRLLRGLDVR